MHTGLFNMLHDAADKYIRAITDGINVDLYSVIKEAIQQYRTVVRDFHGIGHVTAQVDFVIDDFHGAATQHIRRPNYQRIANITGLEYRFFEIGNSRIGWLFEIKPLDRLLETFPVFAAVNGVWAGADNRHTGCFQCPSQF